MRSSGATGKEKISRKKRTIAVKNTAKKAYQQISDGSRIWKVLVMDSKQLYGPPCTKLGCSIKQFVFASNLNGVQGDAGSFQSRGPSHETLMESTKLAQLKQWVYIPPTKSEQQPSVPPYHPCLIVQDSHTDLSKTKPCGCADAYCVKNAPDWIPSAKR